MTEDCLAHGPDCPGGCMEHSQEEREQRFATGSDLEEDDE